SDLGASGALDSKNFSSPVESLLPQISPYVPADQPSPPCSHTRAALTRQTWSCSVCRDSRSTRHGCPTKALLLLTTSSAGRGRVCRWGARPERQAARQENVRGTSPTNH